MLINKYRKILFHRFHILLIDKSKPEMKSYYLFKTSDRSSVEITAKCLAHLTVSTPHQLILIVCVRMCVKHDQLGFSYGCVCSSISWSVSYVLLHFYHVYNDFIYDSFIVSTMLTVVLSLFLTHSRYSSELHSCELCWFWGSFAIETYIYYI